MYPKEEKPLEFLGNKNCLWDKKRSILLGMHNRWLERDVFYEIFYFAMPHIMKAFEIMNGNYPVWLCLTTDIQKDEAQTIKDTTLTL